MFVVDSKGPATSQQTLAISAVAPSSPPAPGTRRPEAEVLVNKFTLAACLTGAIPVPSASAAIVAENAAMVAAVANAMGKHVTVLHVMGAISSVGSINIVGRTVFIDVARLLSWGTGPGGMLVISALGATTAGVQTWVLGQLAIAICESSDGTVPPDLVAGIQAQATAAVADLLKRTKE